MTAEKVFGNFALAPEDHAGRAGDPLGAAITRADVIAAYLYILGRRPDKDTDVDHHLAVCSTLGDLRRAFIDSAEFRLKETVEALPPAWICAETAPGRRRIWLNLADKYVSLSCIRGEFEPVETAFLLSRVESGSTVLDVGANVGWFAVAAADRVGPTGKVHAFEPRPDIVARLAMTVAENGLSERVLVHPVALAERRGSADLVWRPASQNPGHSWLSSAREAEDDGLEHFVVPLMRLDDMTIEGPIGFVKLDVEGAEPLVVAGARKMLMRDRPVILSELYPEQVRMVSNVTPRDYVVAVEGLGYRGRLLGTDEADPDIALADVVDHLQPDRPWTVAFEPI